jgi:hypothetical protein
MGANDATGMTIIERKLPTDYSGWEAALQSET